MLTPPDYVNVRDYTAVSFKRMSIVLAPSVESVARRVAARLRPTNIQNIVPAGWKLSLKK
jgi:hypothetical protein